MKGPIQALHNNPGIFLRSSGKHKQIGSGIQPGDWVPCPQPFLQYPLKSPGIRCRRHFIAQTYKQKYGAFPRALQMTSFQGHNALEYTEGAEKCPLLYLLLRYKP